MAESDSAKNSGQFLRKFRPHLFWLLLISLFLYVAVMPEVLFVNGSDITVDHIKIAVPADDKVWRNIEHGKSKAFRYHVSTMQGKYEVLISLADGSTVQGKFKAITPWNFGHKAIFELSPDLKLRADFSYSFF